MILGRNSPDAETAFTIVPEPLHILPLAAPAAADAAETAALLNNYNFSLQYVYIQGQWLIMGPFCFEPSMSFNGSSFLFSYVSSDFHHHHHHRHHFH